MSKLHDTHFHLDLVKEPFPIVKQIEDSKLHTIAVTNLPALFENTRQMVKGLQYIRPALGFHPELAAKYSEQIGLFKSLIKETKYIGEVGLDNYNKSPEDFHVQKKIFERILQLCAEEKNKIISIHSRKAEKEVILAVGNNFPGKLILHWYSGSLKNIDKALSAGFYFSINIQMTKSIGGRKVIERLPLDSMLLESDSPFIKIDNKISSPLNVGEILNEISIIKKIDVIQIQNIFAANFQNILR